ncbi:MAG: hypothetical protein CMF99_04910 [Candidatus Marinimicrobia bacterium]|nr:hypothetical protein [Candidatus Neomarinimicrobiota bacterium]
MTDSIKYSLAALGLIILLFLYNSSSQRSLEMDGQAIFNGSEEEVFRIKLSEDEKEIELIKTDTTWSFSNNDSLVVKENQVDKIFDRLLKVEKEILITSKEEKWEKFGVDDSLARHITVYDENDNEMLHYLFGNSGQDWQHNYIRKHGSSDVYRTNDNVFFLLNTNSTYWGEKPPEPKPIVNSDSTANIDAQ